MEFFRRQNNNPQISVVPEENKKELELRFNNFNQPSYKKDLLATAQLIHNLMLLVPGTYPDTPEMGINIKQYQFELLTDDELRRIQQHIQNQVETYIPTIQLAQIICRMFVDPVSQVNNLGIGFAIATNPTSIENFFIFFTRSNGNIVSNITF